MPRSQNGYSANDRSKIGTFTVPGAGTRLAIRKGDVATILLYVAAEFDRHVEDIDTPGSRGFKADNLSASGTAPSAAHDDWGFAVRPIRGQSRILSNHASGTAIDLNATQHPRGVQGTFTAKQVAEVRKILHFLEGTVRWGHDYHDAPVDSMHFEIVGSTAGVRRVAKKIRAKQAAEKKAAARKRRAAVIARAKAKAKALAATRRRKAALAAAAAAAAVATGTGIVQGGTVGEPKPTPTVTATAAPTPTPAGSTPKPTVTKPKVTLHRTLRYTRGRKLMHGKDVGMVQKLTGAKVDEDYGPKTKARVQVWQKRHHLRQTGVFGGAEARAAGWAWRP